MHRCLYAFLAAILCLGLTPRLSADSYTDISNSLGSLGIQDTSGNEAPVDKIQLSPPLELENAVQVYVLSFEAYLAAKRSEDPKIRAKLPELLRNYRHSYAVALRKMREDNLLHPMIAQDPAYWYNSKYKKDKGKDMDFLLPDLTGSKQTVKNMVANGDISPKQIKDLIRDNLPSVRGEAEDEQAGPAAAAAPASPPDANSGGHSFVKFKKRKAN